MSTNQALNDDFKLKLSGLNFFSFLHFLIKQLSLVIKKEPYFSQIKKHRFINTSSNGTMLYIEISSEKINTLLVQKMICAADVRCLDTNSKHCLKKLCLKTCLYSTKLYNTDPQPYSRHLIAKEKMHQREVAEILRKPSDITPALTSYL